MSTAPYTVSIVLDHHFGQRVREVHQRGPVWAVDSLANRECAKQLWSEFPTHDHLNGVTIFKPGEGQSPEEILIDHIGTIDEHHGIYSADPPYTIISVVGGTLTPEVRDVGCYLGLRPRRSQSGDRDPQLGITKAGNIYLRSLLVECANHVLGPRGRDSTLRQWGLHLASRGGRQSHNRAIVAVARKLAVLLHRIWITQELYIPFYAVAA